MPFGDYSSFEDCVSQNDDKDSPEGFCAWLHKQLTGTWPSEAASAQVIRFPTPMTLEAIEKICPSCAEQMRAKGIVALYELDLRALSSSVEMELRAFPVSAIDVEEREDDLRPKIVMRPIMFDQFSDDLFGFRERIRASAVDRTLREKRDVRALIDHDPSKILGRISAGTLSLAKESRGLRADIIPPNTSYARDLVTSIRRGDITGGSFRFHVMPEGDEWHSENGQLIRDVTDMEIAEVSVVAFPAYPQTEVELRARMAPALRSLEAWQATHRAGRSVRLARRQHKQAQAR